MRLHELTAAECEKYRRGCNFTDDELAVFDLRVKNRPRDEIAASLAISIATEDRRIRSIKKKISRLEAHGSFHAAPSP